MTHDPVIDLLAHATEVLEAEFGTLPGFEAVPGADRESWQRVLEETAHRLGDNYPYFHPLYAGQMLKPPHPLARAAYALAMKINPNNHARDSGRASSEMELEAVGGIAAMYGWQAGEYLGHLTSSGTIANLEALWVAGQVAEGPGDKGPGTEAGTKLRKRIVGSAQAHYTHQRISAVLKLEYTPVSADGHGRMRMDVLEEELAKGDVGTVVATLGTTGLGAVDPLDEILALKERYGFRVHVDGAYGGYFGLIGEELDEPARRAYAEIGKADSIVVDPHKHGLQPYGCGCVLFRDPGVKLLYKHDSPFTYFTASPLHLGEISLECSRAGASAVALWATQKLLPLTKDGEFAAGLRQSRRAALELDRRVREDRRFVRLGGLLPGSPNARDPGYAPELDIVVWALRAADVQRASEQAQKVFDASAARGLHLALVQLPGSWFGISGGGSQVSESKPGAANLETVMCLRSVLLKPEHEAWMEEIWERLNAACDEVAGD